jgi:hypothetical protein
MELYPLHVHVFVGRPVVRHIHRYKFSTGEVPPTQPTIMPLQSQVKYHIINAKSGTVLDLSGTNQTTSASFVANEIPLMLECSLWLGKQRR